jgi:hypothetical protein
MTREEESGAGEKHSLWPIDPAIGERAFRNLMEMFGEPEIARRQAAGDIPKPFPLKKIQFVFFADRRPTDVRLNQEVKAVATVRLKPGISKEKGDPITLEEIAGMDHLGLPDDDEPDAGHATAVLWGDQWVFSFDFRYNKGLARQTLDAAEEFLETAMAAIDSANTRAAIDNLFSAVELTARADLLQIPDPEVREKSTHSAIKSRVNRFSVHGRIDEQQREVFNLLAGLRKPARYLKGEIDLATDDLLEVFEAIQKWIAQVRQSLAIVRENA